LLPINGDRNTVSAVFTVNEGHFPLKLDQVATPSSDFVKLHGGAEALTLPIHYPADSCSPDSSLRDPRMDEPIPLRTTTRAPPRQRLPSAQALENIASAADAGDRRLTAGTEGEVLVFSPIGPHLAPLEEEEPMLPRAVRRIRGRTPSFDYEERVFLVLPRATTRSEFQQATPSTFRQAEASPHATFWCFARKREVISHHKNSTLGPLLAAPPPGYKVLTTAFVYKNKYVGDDAVMPGDLPDLDWKARMVVKGYLMLEGVDYHDTFAPTASPSSIRLLAAIAARLRCPIKAADFETAFLNSEMDTIVYVSTPAGYESWAKYDLAELAALPADFLPPKEAEPAGCHQLLKGIPGIKQGSRLFYLKLKSFLLAQGYTQLKADPCVYYRVSPSGLVLLAVWVDDVLAVVPNDEEWALFVACIRTEFALSDKGAVSTFLGMDFKQSADFSEVSLSQHKSITDLRERAGMQNCGFAPTPCVAGIIWTKEDCPKVPQPNPPSMPNFRGLTALAVFIASWTRCDIVYVVNKLCKFMANPGEVHIAALKRLIKYLAGTEDWGLVYRAGSASEGQPSLGLHGYTDSSHMDCVDTSRSTIAFMFFLDGAVVSWFSKLHTFVTTCTNHSEYAALFAGAKEAFHLLGWLKPLEGVLNLVLAPVRIFNDNSGASALALDPVGRFKNKHVRMQQHFTQELVAEGTILPVGVRSEDSIVDLGTKALGPNVFPGLASHVVKKVLRDPAD
jgi:hypothetical protein